LLTFANNRENLGAFLGAFSRWAIADSGKGNAMALKNVTVRLAKPGDSDRKLTDEKGLYLLITTSGSKLWRFKFRVNDKEKKRIHPARAAVGFRRVPSGIAPAIG